MKLKQQSNFLQLINPPIGQDNGLQVDMDGNKTYYESQPSDTINETVRITKQYRNYKTLCNAHTKC